MSKTTYQSSKVRTLVAVGVFSALAFICTVLFHFKAAFLSFDLKDAVMALGAMLFGPAYGFAMALLVPIIEAMTLSDTGIYGFIMNVLASVTFVCTSSFIYSRRRSMGGAFVGMLASIVLTTGVMLLANLVITPFYMHVTVQDIIELIPVLFLPFNLTKTLFNACLVFLLYKPVSRALRLAGFVSVTNGQPRIGQDVPETGKKFRPSYVVVPVLSAVVGVGALVYFFVSLHGSFSFR